MYAAAEGGSTLGIPKSVGKEFVGTDESQHQQELAHGKLSDRQKEDIGREGGEHRDDMPESAFLEPKSRKYPVKEKKDGAWKYDRRLLLAAARRARMNGDEALARQADTIREREFGQEGTANDASMVSTTEGPAVALDRASVRSYDRDGRLHVSVSPISKAMIRPYFGREIPGWRDLGLDPQRVYQMLCPPDELEKSSATFNGLPLLSEHVEGLSAKNPREDLVIGSIGSSPSFESPYLKNSLVVWKKPFVDKIDTDEQRELSAAYYYTPEMTPGEYQGEHYDGVMRDIIGNHVALVPDGRAGSDVAVGDAAMAKACDAEQGANGGLPPEMKQGEKPARDDGKEALKAFLSSKLEGDDLAQALKMLEEGTDGDEANPIPVEDQEGAEEHPDQKADEEMIAGLLEKFLRMVREEIAGAKPAEDEDPEGKPDDKPEEKKESSMSKAAMDAAIRSRVTDALAKERADTRERMRAARAAEQAVRPVVGDLDGVAMDSADEVYRAALGVLGVDAKGVHPSALPLLFQQSAKVHTSGRQRPAAVVAMDSAARKTAEALFPDMNRLARGR